MYFSRLRLACAAIVLASPAAAYDEICEDLWLSRNMIMDQAGYCFSSPLGRALFNNEGCIGTDVTLLPNERETIAAIRDYETEQQCGIDTAAARLSLPDLDIRLRLVNIPVRDISESACIGWQGDQVLLLSGAYEGARVTGSVEQGDTVLSAHVAFEDADGRVWVYYTVNPEITVTPPVLAAGWTWQDMFETCEVVAG